MNLITYPLNRESTGVAVTDLQAALLLFLEHSIFELNDDELRFYRDALRGERGHNQYGDVTDRLVGMFQELSRLPSIGDVDRPTAEAINTLLAHFITVRGTLVDAFDDALPEYQVSLSDYDLDGATPIGTTSTRENGEFEFVFRGLGDRRLAAGDDSSAPDLLFQVYDGQQVESAVTSVVLTGDGYGYDTSTEVPRLAPGDQAPIVLMNVTADLALRLRVNTRKRAPTEFEQLVARLNPFMGRIAFADLAEDETHFQISFLTRETGIDRAKIEQLRDAFRQERAVPCVPAWAFFGLAAAGTDLASLAYLPVEEVARLLTPLQPESEPQDPAEVARCLIEFLKGRAVENKTAALTASVDPWMTPLLGSAEKTAAFLEAYVRHEGPVESFWQKMAEQPEYADVVPALQLNAQLAQVTLNNTGLAAALRERGIDNTRRLVDLTPETWEALALEHRDGIPAHITGADDAARAKTYARELQAVVELAFPTPVIRKSIQHAPTRDFLDRNPDFDFTTTPVESYLQARGEEAFTGIEQPDEVKAQLRLTQRLYTVTANAADTQTLMDLDFTSAHQIARLSVEDFARRIDGAIAPEKVRPYWEKAVGVAEASAMVYHQMRDTAYSAAPAAARDAAGNPQPDMAQPDWRELFGPLALCQCEHCRSVYSPAAYFVDLLHVLLGQNKGAARSELFRRRPDLRYTKLSCEHTETLIPYIDLVNEVLEIYVAQSHVGDPDADTHAKIATNDTSGFASADLIANPQHPNPAAAKDAADAYALIAAAKYPLTLPFDMNLETARQFLDEQGSSRFAVMQALGDPAAYETRAERLGISAGEFEVITLKQLDGVTSAGIDVIVDLWGNPPIPVGQTAGQALAIVDIFIQRAGISAAELIDLLATRTLNPNFPINVFAQQLSAADRTAWFAAHPEEDQLAQTVIELGGDIKDPCNLAKTVIRHLDGTFLSDDELSLFNRFIRLWKRLGCTVPELDALLSSLGAPDITPEVVRDLSILWRLRTSLDLPLDLLAALVGNIPTAGANTPYSRLFLNKAILQIDAGFMLNVRQTELENAADPLALHVPAILAAFRVSEEELNAIARYTNLTLAVDPLNLANLSQLYRYVLLARGMGMKIKALITWLDLLAATPWTDASGLLDTHTRLAKLQRYDFKAADFAYIFLDERVPGYALPPTAEIIAQSARTLRAGLLKIRQENTPKDGVVTTDFLRTELGLLLEPPEMSRLIGILDGTNMTDPFSDLVNPKLLDAYKDLLLNYLMPADANALAATADVPTRLTNYWQKLEAALLPALRITFVRQHLIAAFKVAAAIVTLVLDDPTALAACLGVEAGTPAGDQAYADKYVWMHKFTWLADKLKLTREELDFFQANPDFANFDWKTFDFGLWLRVADYAALRDGLPPTEEPLLAVFRAAASGGDISAAIVAVTGWDQTNVEHFVNARPAADFRNEIALGVLQDQIALSNLIGVSIKNLEAWATATVSHDQAQDIKRTLKAKYDETAWIEVSANVHNRVRTRLRDALVAYLLQKPQIKALGLRDADDLFGYFLIDVQMEACMRTSRLVQAISSVQSFVQRCLLDLEVPAVTADLIDASQWKWMRNYRVWEANRKVFLYPENWIEPELRDNKSLFFRELENELLQSEVTNEFAEQTLMNYLEKLDEVARLDVCGIYEDSAGQELHVFARAFNTPPQYFYRKLDMAAQVWTAWERVPLDIQGVEDGDSAGVHLMPVVYNRRLYLFWGLFTEKPDRDKRESDKLAYKGWKKDHDQWAAELAAFRKQKQALANSQEGPTNNTTSEWQLRPEPEEPAMEEFPWAYYEVRVAWSEYRSNKWSNKRVSQSFLRTNSDKFGVYGIWPYRFTLRVDDELRIALYLAPASAEVPIGEFRLNCNSRIAALDLQEEWSTLEVIGPQQVGFYQSYLAAGNTGRAIKWHEAASRPFSLVVNKGKSTLDVLGASEQEYKTVFAADSTFGALEAPDFFYQDARRDYYVEYDYNWFSDSLEGIKYGSKAVLTPSQQLAPAENKPGSINQGLYAQAHRFDQVTKTGLDELVASKQLTASTALSIQAQQTMSGTLGGSFFDTASDLYTANIGEYYLKPPPARRLLTFRPFFHAYVCKFMAELNRGGINGLLTIQNQLLSDTQLLIIGVIGMGGLTITTTNNFDTVYKPVNVAKPHPLEEVDFTTSGAYSLYNWELFFHIPMLIANRLSKNQRFEEAMRWYHFVFNPTTNEKLNSSARYWQVLPFRNTPKETLESLLMQLHNPAGDPKRKQLEDAIAAWRKSPFNPHLIARMRLIAYQKNAVMKYLDNLIAWADYLFRQDTIENINQATQLYILAAEIVGRRPEVLETRGVIEALNYDELEKAGLDAFSNALVQLETIFPFFTVQPAAAGAGAAPLLNTTTPALYFCLPYNEKLMGYWDTIADRLYKIRHCQNIEGVESQLALFQPPIDPALLVRAIAGGVDISSVLADLNSPPPHYRFNYMIARALEICGQLQTLGNALLSALEKRDAEELALMRSQDDTLLLNLAKSVRKLQLTESQRNREGLEKTREVTELRSEYYTQLVQDGLNGGEKAQQALAALSMVMSVTGQGIETAAASLSPEPDEFVGGLGGMAAGAINLEHVAGGTKGAAALSATGRFFNMLATMATWGANWAQTNAGYQRRADDWKYQADLANREIAQIDKQILAAQIREQIAEKELDNHEQQLENARQVDEFLRSKYTQQELYGWMVGELSTVYFQCYQLAYDMAKKAEKAYRYELGLPDSSFVQFGIWDSFRKGLLSGDRLYLSLKQMEKSYVDLNRREYEISKRISLLQHAPLALIQLKELGSCQVELPEMLFDVDYPGHYMRRIKSVSVTIPCVAGPYTSVNCTLTLLRSKTRVSAIDAASYIKDMEIDNQRVVTNFSASESIATSSGQNDSGLFEFSFRDERYLPFEGAGAVSVWRIDLPKEFKSLDYDTISDVVIQVNYTARQGGGRLQKAAIDALRQQLKVATGAPQSRLFSLRHEFPSEWYRLAVVAVGFGDHRQAFSLHKERFPFIFGGSKVSISRLNLFGVPAGSTAPAMMLDISDPDGQAVNLTPIVPALGHLVGKKSANTDVEVKKLGPAGTEADWTITVKKANVAGSLATLEDLLLLCEYTVV